MKQPLDVLIGGAGIIGIAVAERLKANGLNKVLVIEKESMPATGSTGRSAGGIRQQFGDEAKIRAAAFGFSIYESFEEKYGEDPSFMKHGYLILRSDKAGASELRKDVELQKRSGLDTCYLEPGGVGKLFPLLNTGDIEGASFNRSDGYLDFHAVVQGYLKSFKDRGGRIDFDVRANRLLFSKGRVIGVAVPGGEILAEKTVLASGPQTGALLGEAGLKIPVRTCRRQIFVTGPVKGVRADWPLVLDVDAPFYFRPEGDGLIMSLAETDEMEPPAQGNEIPLSRGNMDVLASRASHRCPCFNDAQIRSGWAGLRSITPDERPLLGPVNSHDGLYLATGFSGHGITLAPFAAEYIAREMTGNPFESPMRDPFKAARFFR